MAMGVVALVTGSVIVWWSLGAGRATTTPTANPSATTNAAASAAASATTSTSTATATAAVAATSTAAVAATSTTAVAANPNPTVGGGEVGGAVQTVLAAKLDLSPLGTQVLLEALASDDPIVVVEAADGLVARRSRDGASALMQMDLRRRVEVAPAIIDSLGKLGAALGEGDPAFRDRIAERLLEALRATAGERALLLQTYEALGETRSTRAISPLQEALVQTPDYATKSVIVTALARIDPTASRESFVVEHAKVAQSSEGDPFVEQTRQELLDHLATALDGRVP